MVERVLKWRRKHELPENNPNDVQIWSRNGSPYMTIISSFDEPNTKQHGK